MSKHRIRLSECSQFITRNNEFVTVKCADEMEALVVMRFLENRRGTLGQLMCTPAIQESARRVEMPSVPTEPISEPAAETGSQSAVGGDSYKC